MVKTNRFFPLVAILLLLALPTMASAQSSDYDMYVDSVYWQSGYPVWVNISGPRNMSITVRITNEDGDIVAGRDTTLNETGKYVHEWVPSRDGPYNATVVYATGITISRRFLIQQQVTPGQLGEVYNALFRMENRLLSILANLTNLTYAALIASVGSLVFSLIVFNYTRKRVSRADSEFERFLKEDVKDAFQRMVKKREDTP